MAHPLTQAEFIKIIDQNLTEIVNDTSKYQELRSVIPKLFREFPSKRAYEEFYQIGAVPDIVPFNGRITTLSRYPGYSTKIEPGEFTGQLQTERKLLEDRQFNVLGDNAKGLQESAWRVADKKATRIITNATSTAFDFMTSEEGVSLASSSHKTKYPNVSTSTGFGNVGTSPLTKASVAATRLLMRKFKQANGERYDTGDEYAILHPDALSDKVDEIIGTPKGLDSGEGTINVNYRRFTSIPIMRWDDTSTTSWAMVDLKKMKQDLIWIWRTKPQSERSIDWNTYSIMEKVYARFGGGYKDWRWMYYHNVS